MEIKYIEHFKMTCGFFHSKYVFTGRVCVLALCWVYMGVQNQMRLLLSGSGESRVWRLSLFQRSTLKNHSVDSSL